MLCEFIILGKFKKTFEQEIYCDVLYNNEEEIGLYLISVIKRKYPENLYERITCREIIYFENDIIAYFETF